MPTDLDVYAPEGWVDDALFRPEVRDAYRRLVAQGWTDALRALHPDERIYTFWKYFRNAFARDAGLRIDHVLLSPSLAGCLVAAGVDRDVRARERSSDHGAGLDRTCGRRYRISAAGAAPEESSIGLTLGSSRSRRWAGETPFLAQHTCGRGRSPPYRADPTRLADPTRRNGMARRNPPRKVTYFEPVAPRLARNTVIESV